MHVSAPSAKTPVYTALCDCALQPTSLLTHDQRSINTDRDESGDIMMHYSPSGTPTKPYSCFPSLGPDEWSHNFSPL